MNNDASFLQRLKERKLVQWALAYLAAAFVVFQSIEVMAEPWGIAAGLQRAVHILLLIGLFVVLTLAWYHGEKGQQRASGAELLMITALLAIAGILLTVLARGDRDAPSDVEQSPVAEAPPREKPAIAVLPFENFSEDPDDAYFADGMHEEINAQLARVSGLKVISRTSVMQYREARPPVREIATALGVDFILEGSARLAEERVRLTVQLIDASGDEHIWADQYDRDLTADHLFAIQTAVAEQVAAALEVELLPSDRDRIERQPTENLAAYELYLLGRSALKGGYPEGSYAVDRSIGYLERAIEADSAFSLAYSGLAEANISLHYWGRGGKAELGEANRVAEWAAERALALDSSSAEAWTARAAAHMHADYDWERAELELRRAIELDPGYYSAHGWLDDLLRIVGRYEESVTVSAKALGLDPLYEGARSNYASSLWGAGRLSEAAEQFGATTAVHLEFLNQVYADTDEGWIAAPPGRFYDVFVYQEMGLTYDEALQALLQSLRKTHATAEQIAAYQRNWRGLSWEAMWSSELDTDWDGLSPAYRAVALTRLGRTEEAVLELRRLHDIGAPGLLWYHQNPFFRALENDAGYIELMEELGLRP